MKSVRFLTGTALWAVAAMHVQGAAAQDGSAKEDSAAESDAARPDGQGKNDISDINDRNDSIEFRQTEQDPSSSPLPPLDEPIISDREFEDSLPPLDPELNAPLQSMEDFEAEQDQQAEADAKTDEDLASLPALQDGDPNEEIADVAVTDGELEEPLPALSEFKVEPVEVATDETEGDSVEIKYSYKLEGLDDVPGADAISSQFEELSALNEGDGKAANGVMVSARAKEDEGLITRILQSQGYYDAAATSSLQQIEGGGPPLTALITVSPGKRYAFGTIEFDAEPTTPPDLIDDSFVLNTGDPIIAGDVLGAEANISLQLPQEGYPFVELGERDILLDGTALTGDYTLPVDTGPRSSFGGFTTSGNLAFDAEHVGLLARFDRGDLYDIRKTDDLRAALVATSLFSSVGVEPVRTGELAPDGTEYVNLDVTQDAGPPRSISGSAGYGTGQGFRVEGAWTHRNFFPPEGALSFEAIAGTREQGLGATFRRSNAGRRDRTVSLRAFANHSDYNAFEAFTGTLAGRVSYDSTPIWQKKFTYGYGFELTGTNESQYDFNLKRRTRDTYLIAALPSQIGFDQSDSLLNPTTGYRALLRVSPEGSLQGGFTPYVRSTIEGSAYYPVGDSLVVAGRVKVGTIAGANRTDIAPSRRFYGGGGGSVRGFGYQELGPKDPNDDPIGGRSLAEAALEVRYRFGDYGIVPFVDIGQVYTSSTPSFDDLRVGVGIGGRFYTNFGPFRLDVATPLGRKAGESLVSVYISIGQAF